MVESIYSVGGRVQASPVVLRPEEAEMRNLQTQIWGKCMRLLGGEKIKLLIPQNSNYTYVAILSEKALAEVGIEESDLMVQLLSNYVELDDVSGKEVFTYTNLESYSFLKENGGRVRLDIITSEKHEAKDTAREQLESLFKTINESIRMEDGCFKD